MLQQAAEQLFQSALSDLDVSLAVGMTFLLGF